MISSPPCGGTTKQVPEHLRMFDTSPRYCARTGPEVQNRGGHPDFRAHLLGRISWVTSVDAAKGTRLRAQFERICWPDAAAAPGPGQNLRR